MKLSSILSTAILSFLFFTSCKKATTDATASMKYQLKTTNPIATVNTPATPGSVQWTSGFASANEIKLEAKNNNNEIEFKNETIQRIDLFAPVATGLGNIVVPPGTYTEVEFKVELNNSGADAALVLNGQFTNGTGVVTPIVFTVNGLFEIKGEQASVVVTGNSSITAITTLNLSLLTTGISQAMLNAATLTGGKIVISASSNSNLYAIIVANLHEPHDEELHDH